ncbi:hypothetical protein [Tumebacillus permanentifrigoris]|uniref:Uncharacterized protein n=1 Tax=Tumebacillus permanentifrigoris TaxID=378543 RepID=A0A316D7V7_9BACL|nr:hypothetical protein [Tumebacillus permanentifrigoris]PWK09015.1 hypothetical protein C7459_11481 [Tumebacillus permanentifrigoris]
MTNKEYQEAVEKKYNQSLYEIMYDMCVIQNVVPVQGASILGVPKQTFNQWRNKFRLGPMQRRADLAVDLRRKSIDEYKIQLEGINFDRPFASKDDYSLAGFKELIERYIELYKYKRTSNTDTFAEMSLVLQIGIFEQILSHLDDYSDGRLYEKFLNEASFTKDDFDN